MTMTPLALRAITLSLNDERGTGGQSKLGRLLGWHHATVWRKLNGKSRITPSDELAIKQGQANARAGTLPSTSKTGNHTD
jgi:hypothetical protein